MYWFKVKQQGFIEIHPVVLTIMEIPRKYTVQHNTLVSYNSALVLYGVKVLCLTVHFLCILVINT
jgi:hypothetical protein